MTEMELSSRRKIYCNTCKALTNHELRAKQPGPYFEESDDSSPYPTWIYWEKAEYRLWGCLGCDTATLEEAFTSQPMTDENGEQLWASTYYPKRARQDLQKKQFRKLDKKLISIYNEVIESFNTGLRILCAIGLRAILEGICVDKGITDEKAWGLEAKLKMLEADKHLPSNIVECLHSFKFIGDTAAHKLDAPSQEELKLAIEVMEDLLNFLYEIEYKLVAKAQVLAQKYSAEMAEMKKRKGTGKEKSRYETD